MDGETVEVTPIRKGEVCEHVFAPPTSEESIYAYRCSKINGIPTMIVRSSNVEGINSHVAKTVADNAKKKLSEYSDCGLEVDGPAFPVDNETGELMDIRKPVPDGAKVTYERRFKINPGMGGSMFT